MTMTKYQDLNVSALDFIVRKSGLKPVNKKKGRIVKAVGNIKQ